MGGQGALAVQIVDALYAPLREARSGHGAGGREDCWRRWSTTRTISVECSSKRHSIELLRDELDAGSATRSCCASSAAAGNWASSIGMQRLLAAGQVPTT